MDDIKTIMIYDSKLGNAKKISIDDIKKSVETIDVIQFGTPMQIGENVKVLYTTKTAPYTYVAEQIFGYKKSLHIDEEYYLENQQEVDDTISVIAKSKSKKITILEPTLTTIELIDVISSNPNLEEVTLGNRDNPFTLDVMTYQKFKNSNIKKVNTDNVVEELKTIFDGLIGYNYDAKQIGFSSLYDLKQTSSFNIWTSLSEQELNNLKYINDNREVKISVDNEQNLYDIVKNLRKYNKKGPFTIEVKDKNKFNKMLFDNLEEFLSMNITVKVGLSKVDIKDYAGYESRLLKMVDPALGLSPFEKYLFAYNIVKKYKKYKENPENSRSSRDIYQLLDNDYMVCVGYSELLQDLLNKLGILNRDYSVEVDITFDNVPTDTHVVTEDMLKSYDNGGHARRQVHLVDPKYGIDGIFIADPTWDNDMENDAYNYALMTPDEYNGIKRYNYLSWYSADELLFVHSLEEFYDKANLLMNKNITVKKEKYPEGDIIQSLAFMIEEIDPVAYQNLCEKYPKISTKFSEYTKEELSKIMLELGTYIVSKVNKPVTGLQFKNAIYVLYERCYGVTDKEELNKKIYDIMEYNKNRHTQKFPLRYKQDLEGNNVPYMNITNKFDIESIENDLGKAI